MADPSVIPESTFAKYGPVWALVAVLIAAIGALFRIYHRTTTKRLTTCDEFMKAISESSAESGAGRQALLAAVERVGTSVTVSVERVGEQVRDLKTRMRDQAMLTFASSSARMTPPTTMTAVVDDDGSGPIDSSSHHRRR